MKKTLLAAALASATLVGTARADDVKEPSALEDAIASVQKAQEKKSGKVSNYTRVLELPDNTTTVTSDTQYRAKDTFVGVGQTKTEDILTRYGSFHIERDLAEKLKVAATGGFAKTEATDYEGRLHFDLGDFRVGGGFLEREEASDRKYARLTHKFKHEDIDLEAGLLYQDVENAKSGVGASLFASNGEWRIGTTITPEDHSSLLAYTAPETNGLRPAVEVFRYDHSLGEEAGPKITAVNATLDYGGKGFLTDKAAKGRAYTTTDINTANPFSQLAQAKSVPPTQSLGKTLNARFTELELPDGTNTQSYDVSWFPLEGNLAPIFVKGVRTNGDNGIGLGYHSNGFSAEVQAIDTPNGTSFFGALKLEINF